MSVDELRDHAKEILIAIADEMDTTQSEPEREAKSKGDPSVLEEVVRFNESIDRGLAEAMVAYLERVANSRDSFLALLGQTCAIR
ncbi:hypothetical protein QTH97_30320 [Variovorax sp. J22R24]|uniref:hypothetical protein n=1 Tax=Variovorax gracilis TaxID=3053502 RepID=UPI0025755FB6|nr:hypothetical protein [Variovorax sp. J22R24]MDM0109268.1 hypothetical protein [Variovorax sp. J22R24]